MCDLQLWLSHGLSVSVIKEKSWLSLFAIKTAQTHTLCTVIPAHLSAHTLLTCCQSFPPFSASAKTVVIPVMNQHVWEDRDDSKSFFEHIYMCTHSKHMTSTWTQPHTPLISLTLITQNSQKEPFVSPRQRDTHSVFHHSAVRLCQHRWLRNTLTLTFMVWPFVWSFVRKVSPSPGWPIDAVKWFCA